MADGVFDGDWLTKELCEVLSWDEAVVEGVVEAIGTAHTEAELEDIVSNFMSESEEARRAVSKHLAWKDQGGEQFKAASSKPTRHHVSDSAASSIDHARETSAKPKPERKLFDPRGQSRSSRATRWNTPERWKTQRVNSDRVTQSRVKKPEVDSSTKQEPSAHVMERTAANCLGCGKIYDSRKMTHAMQKFIESGGVCDFCGENVCLSLSDTCQDESITADEAVAEQDGTKIAEQNETKEAEDIKKAQEFKDRLVEYDRNSAQRTTVLDDQSDYFEIETNVWLEEREKRELRMRRELEDEMEKSYRKKVHYTIDLLGRRIFVSEDAPPSEETERIAHAAADAAKSTSAEIPQGGGTATRQALQTASRLLDPDTTDLKFRVPTNPDVLTASPIFLPTRAAIEKSSNQNKGTKWIQGYKGRLQHDDVFAAFDEEVQPEVLSSDLSAYGAFFDQFDNGIFDLCPETTRPSSLPSISVPKSQPVVSVNARLSTMLMPGEDVSNLITKGPQPPRVATGDALPEGIVLMKGWLSFEDQLRIVETVRNLGIGIGGFYTPMYQKKAQLKLKMMCLGWHWNPVNRVYESARSDFDGAPAPPIPDFLKELVANCMRDADRMHSRTFSKTDPNVCICNFYAQDSLLGFHQDKEEGEESLKRQIPVVSFSIGATGEFVFNKTRSMETAQSILLESGDALIFGGPSRMIFHGIRKIFPESMPQELAEFTGMRNGRLNLTIRQYSP